MQVIKPTKVETTYRHKETGELFKERKDWEAKGYKEEDMAQDVNVLMPSLDLLGETKQNSTMAISRMQQPRQMYGLGSFVKKAVRKVTRPFTKVAKKIVPKEVAGIMRVAAPFLPPQLRAAAYLLGTAKQTGRISPIDLALVAAPRIGRMQLPGYDSRFEKLIPDQMEGLTISEAIGDLPAFGKTPLGDRRTIQQVLTGGNFKDIEGVKTTTSGIFGKGGEFFQFGKEGGPGILETKAGQTLFGKKKDDGTFGPSLTKIGSIGVGLFSLIKDAKTPDEAGQALAASTGDPADYDRGYALFSQLKPELFEVPEEFRMSVNVKDGGRIGFDEGTPKPTKPIARGRGLAGLIGKGLEDVMDVKDFGNMFIIITNDGEQIIMPKERNLEDEGIIVIDPKSFDSDMFLDLNTGKTKKASGGIMRTNYARGSDDDDDKPVLPEDPTKPINPFGPKPIKPLGDMKMAGSDRYQRILEQLINELEDRLGRELTNAEYDMVSKEAYDRLSDPDFAVGGRVDYALGTKPTAEESGLGGLPIEADMRYTGGFMPYGAKEKADDVPARLSKNEFVFTADAVRAAGGGSVNEGAKKMYQTMKQLEAKPEAKGMTA